MQDYFREKSLYGILLIQLPDRKPAGSNDADKNLIFILCEIKPNRD
jgi:hypothetical protein